MERLRSSYLEDDAAHCDHHRNVRRRACDACRIHRSISMCGCGRSRVPHAAGSRRASRAPTSASRIFCARRRATFQAPSTRVVWSTPPSVSCSNMSSSMERAVNPLFSRREYAPALTQLASLREDVDRFFDDVMVMAEDPDVRANRLGLAAAAAWSCSCRWPICRACRAEDSRVSPDAVPPIRVVHDAAVRRHAGLCSRSART